MKQTVFTIILLFAFAQSILAQNDRQFIRQGNKLYRQRKYAQAETAYRKALSQNPSNARAMYNLGNALYAQNKKKEALAQHQKAATATSNKQLVSPGIL